MPAQRRDLVLLIPGQGAQYPRMAAGLYGWDMDFTTAIDSVLDMFGDPAGLRAAWLGGESPVPLDDVVIAQPLLFAIGYALGRMLLAWGLRPAAILGHSVGELVAATLAGVFRVEEAAAVMRDRVARLAATPPGGMLAVSASEAELRSFLDRHPDVAVGAVNAPRQIVLAGFAGPLRAIGEDLKVHGHTVWPVAALTAFHSPLLMPLLADPGPLAECTLSRPQIPVWSAFSAGPLDAEAARNHTSWRDHPAAPVLFWPALDALLSAGRHLLVDVGPGQGLAMIARRHPRVRTGRTAVTALLPARPGRPEDDRATVAAWRLRIRQEGYEPRPASGAKHRADSTEGA